MNKIQVRLDKTAEDSMEYCKIHPKILLNNIYFVKEYDEGRGDKEYWTTELIDRKVIEKIKCHVCSFLEREVQKSANKLIKRMDPILPLLKSNEDVSPILFILMRIS